MLLNKIPGKKCTHYQWASLSIQRFETDRRALQIEPRIVACNLGEFFIFDANGYHYRVGADDARLAKMRKMLMLSYVSDGSTDDSLLWRAEEKLLAMTRETTFRRDGSDVTHLTQ